jgi:hypothetical protein
MTLPDVMMPHSYVSEVLALSALAAGLFVTRDDEYVSLWNPHKHVPAVIAGALAFAGCLDADHTQ